MDKVGHNLTSYFTNKPPTDVFTNVVDWLSDLNNFDKLFAANRALSGASNEVCMWLLPFVAVPPLAAAAICPILGPRLVDITICATGLEGSPVLQGLAKAQQLISIIETAQKPFILQGDPPKPDLKPVYPQGSGGAGSGGASKSNVLIIGEALPNKSDTNLLKETNVEGAKISGTQPFDPTNFSSAQKDAVQNAGYKFTDTIFSEAKVKLTPAMITDMTNNGANIDQILNWKKSLTTPSEFTKLYSGDDNALKCRLLKRDLNATCP